MTPSTRALLADLLDVAERLLLDRRQAAGDVALGRLAVGEVAGLVAVDHVLVAVEHEHEALAHRVAGAARGDDVLAAGELGRLAEAQRAAERCSLSKALPTVGLAPQPLVVSLSPHFGADPELGDRAGLALLLARPLHVLARRLAGAAGWCRGRRGLDAEADDRLAGGWMPSTTFCVQPSSMPMTTTAATFGLQPVPIRVRKCSSRSAPNCSRP
jgi:hypothetical protein